MMTSSTGAWLGQLIYQRLSRRSVAKAVGAVILPGESHAIVPAAKSVSDSGINISSHFRRAWIAAGGIEGRLGPPLTDEYKIADGEAIYFERGCLWRGPESGGQIVESHVLPPVLGRPAMMKTTAVHLPRLACWFDDANKSPSRTSVANAQQASQILRKLWQDRLALRPVLPPGHPRDLTPLVVSPSKAVLSIGPAAVEPSPALDAMLSSGIHLEDRTLYDIVLITPDERIVNISLHALYVQDSWERFGFIHATDLHVARRDDVFERFFSSAKNPGETRHNFVNYNNGFRDLIRYANRLHGLGLVDLMLITGDLVDYLYEQDDPHLGIQEDDPRGGGNFEYFRQILLGQVGRPGSDSLEGAPYGELLIPIYTALGNHDYRRGRYELAANIKVDIDLGDLGIQPLPQYRDHNFLECEALDLQPDEMWVDIDTDSERAHDMLEVNPQKERYDPGRIPALSYYRRKIGGDVDGSFVIGGPDGVADLGVHRIVMLNTLWDAGIPKDDDWDFIVCKIFGCSEDGEMILDGSPNQLGFDTAAFDLFKREIARAPQDGIFIVGLHGPILNPAGSEYPHYFRETEHAEADPKETLRFLARHGAEILQQCEADPLSCVTAFYEGWGQALGKPYFSSGDIDTFLDWSVARCYDDKGDSQAEQFLKICAGSGVTRPADLVLFGHVHRRVEFRVDLDDQGQLRYYTDFYTENPATYYNSKKYAFDDTVQISIVLGANPQAQPMLRRDDQVGAPVGEYRSLAIPPYADPLNTSKDPRAWWGRHRPVLLQTASLGPIDFNQRVSQEDCAVPATPWDPSFQGFRLISVAGDHIAKVHYVTIDALYANDFSLPLEDELVALDTS